MEELVCGGYRIIGKLGQGGMAEIFSARHDLTDGEAAVKILNARMSSQPDILKRFAQEARAAAKIKHPGIVEIYGAGHTPDGRAYIVMEKLEGETLSDRLKRQGTLSIDEAKTLMRQIAGVMKAAHNKGIIHRDLKPENLFIVLDPEVPGGERVKVLDFGLAKLVMEFDASLVTQKTAIFGTPAYMAPEQCQSSASVDSRADLYSLGCLFYRCVCGAPPFSSADPIEILGSHINREPTPPSHHRPDLPSYLDALIMRLLAKSPDQRVQSCADFIADLDGTASPSAATLVNLDDDTTVVGADEDDDETVMSRDDAIPCRWSIRRLGGCDPHGFRSGARSRPSGYCARIANTHGAHGAATACRSASCAALSGISRELSFGQRRRAPRPPKARLGVSSSPEQNIFHGFGWHHIDVGRPGPGGAMGGLGRKYCGITGCSSCRRRDKR